MNNKIFELEATVLNALAHPLRLKILEKLRQGPCCVCKIIPYVGGEQSNVSHHLAILRNAGIVKSEKHGLEVWYEVTDQRIFEIIDLLGECIAKHYERNINAFKTLLKEMK